MRKIFWTITAAASVFGLAGTAHAEEMFIGVAAHGVDTPASLDTGEGGANVQLGYRGDPIEGLSFIGAPSPYIFVAAHSEGVTHIVAGGLSWKFGDKIYVRPGIGFAVHSGPKLRFADDGGQTQLGSRVLFEPELVIGIRVTEQVDVEASWVHVSHARLFDKDQNPGLDIIGLRVNLRLP